MKRINGFVVVKPLFFVCIVAVVSAAAVIELCDSALEHAALSLSKIYKKI